MIHYHWKGCPPDTREQIEQVTAIFQQAAGLDLLGVYLHGSLALGCFDPRRSDLDLLVVLRKPLTLPSALSSISRRGESRCTSPPRAVT